MSFRISRTEFGESSIATCFWPVLPTGRAGTTDSAVSPKLRCAALCPCSEALGFKSRGSGKSGQRPTVHYRPLPVMESPGFQEIRPQLNKGCQKPRLVCTLTCSAAPQSEEQSQRWYIHKYSRGTHALGGPCFSGHRPSNDFKLTAYSSCRIGTLCQQLQFKPRRFLGLDGLGTKVVFGTHSRS